jgi:phenylalanyl-tRNA synthetase beta subunit
MSDLIREEMAFIGYKEGLNFALVAKEDLTSNILVEKDDDMVKILNNKVEEFSVGRTKLMPGLLKWLNHNKINKVNY